MMVGRPPDRRVQGSRGAYHDRPGVPLPVLSFDGMSIFGRWSRSCHRFHLAHLHPRGRTLRNSRWRSIASWVRKPGCGRWILTEGGRVSSSYEVMSRSYWIPEDDFVEIFEHLYDSIISESAHTRIFLPR